jgi:large subunit ribosomal protein L23
MSNILKAKLLVTEKTSPLQAFSKYVFLVTGKPSKTQLKEYFTQLLPGRKILSINTLSVIPKKVRRGKHQGYTASRKKVFLTISGEPLVELSGGN